MEVCLVRVSGFMSFIGHHKASTRDFALLHLPIMSFIGHHKASTRGFALLHLPISAWEVRVFARVHGLWVAGLRRGQLVLCFAVTSRTGGTGKGDGSIEARITTYIILQGSL